MTWKKLDTKPLHYTAIVRNDESRVKEHFNSIDELNEFAEKMLERGFNHMIVTSHDSDGIIKEVHLSISEKNGFPFWEKVMTVNRRSIMDIIVNH